MRLFKLINGLSGKNKWLDKLAVFFAVPLGYVLILFLFFFAFSVRNMAMFFLPVLAGLLSRFAINEAVYFFWQKKRPPAVLGIRPLIKVPAHPAFPSGHASFFFALSFAVFPYSPWLSVMFVFLTFFISLFRVFVGVHWPSDVLAGLLGILPALLTIRAL